MDGTVTERLAELSREFTELEPRERLELLLEFSEQLAPLPERYQVERDAGANRVHECQTPVFLWVELEGKDAAEKVVRVFADVAPEAPTVKGFVSVLVTLFAGRTPDEVLASDPNLVQRFALEKSLGMVRMRGLQAITHHLRKKIAAAADA